MPRRFLLGVLLILATLGMPGREVTAQDQRCFPETGKCISGAIRRYWEQNGGLPVFGYPTTDLAVETNAEGFTGPTQWFERDRLEDHGREVLAGRLGAQKLALEGRPWEGLPKAGAVGAGCRVFPETGHSLCPPFRQYWERNGGLARFGFPISEPATERNAAGFTGTMQWFERRRMEIHPENPAPFDILLGLLGNEVRGVGAPPPPAGAISGQVRFKGGPAAGVVLQLRKCISNTCSTALTTTTDANGNYRFAGAPTLQANELYYVQFSNDPESGNAADPARLAVWWSRDITTYAAGSSADGGSFDIADVELIAPPDDATVGLPSTFSWTRRGVPNDRYSLAFAREGGEEVCYTNLSEATSVVLDEALRADCNLNFNTPYEWYVYVADGDWSNGFGLSYYYQIVRLSGG
jgi:hypothetical protein